MGKDTFKKDLKELNIEITDRQIEALDEYFNI